MATRLPAFDKSGAEGTVLNDVNTNIENKLKKLRDFQPCMLDVSIREPTAYSSWSHRLSDKMDTLKLIREFGFRDIMLGEFKPWDTVDEQFAKLLTEEEKRGCFAFSPTAALKNGVVDLDNSVPLQKAAALAPNVLFEFDISTATEAQAEVTLERFDRSIDWIIETWKARGIQYDGVNGRIYINIYDTFEAYYRNRDIYVRVIKYLGAHPRVHGVLFEDELGIFFHFQVGELTRFIRSLVPAPKKVLVHLHENSGTMYAAALEAAINGADGLWAGFVPVGGMVNNAASSVFLANLLRIGNPNVQTQFKMQTTIPLVRKLDRINQPRATDPLHPVIGEDVYKSTLRVFEQFPGDQNALPPEAIGTKWGYRVVPAIANNYAMSRRLDELGITYPSQPSTTVPGDQELQYPIFRTMWDLIQQELIVGRKVDFNEEVSLRELLDRARQIHKGRVPGTQTPTVTPLPAGARIEFTRSLAFDGAGDYVEVRKIPNPTRAVTISCWVKSATPNWNSTGCLVSQRDAFILHPEEGGKGLRFYVFSGGGWRSAGVGVAVDITQWHHYAGTFDGDSIRIYIDGNEVARSDFTGTINADTGPLFIGWDDGQGGRYFKGRIADVRLWDRALREADLKANMNVRLAGNEAGLIGYWPLATDASDKTSLGRHGEINGALFAAE